MKPLQLAFGLLLPTCALAQNALDTPTAPASLAWSNVKVGRGGTCSGASVIYNTTHASNQGAEVTAAANGPATSMGDLITLAAGSRFVCEIQVEVFTLTAVTPFDLTLSLWTDCTTSGAANSSCGNGTGTLIPGSTVTVTGITPPALGTIFTVLFDMPNVDLSGEADNTIAVSINASRSDVFWRLGETVAVGAQPDAAPSVVMRCGSTAANNGCSRNFGITNNFAIQILANTTPVELISMGVE